MDKTRRSFLKLLAVTPAIAWVAFKNLSQLEQANGATVESKKPATLKLYSAEKKGYITSKKVVKPAEEWRKILTEEQFQILRNKGTERAFTGKYWNNHEKGIYRCAGCQNDLFSSETKFESGTGWPSFWKPIAPENVATESDSSHMMVRTEVLCARCDGHLGHVFDDGPEPTGLRYCLNSVSLSFVKA